jgi:hypothetical protein
MDTKDKTAQGEPGRSSALPVEPAPPDTAPAVPADAPAAADKAEDAPPARCGAILRRSGEPCKNFAIKGGRCRWHVVDEVVPADELEALRQLQEAAAQHALDAFHAVEGGANEKDQDFNRNARTAAQLAKIRRGLVGPGEIKDGDQVNVPGNGRDGAEAPALESAPVSEVKPAPESETAPESASAAASKSKSSASDRDNSDEQG